MHAIAEHTTSAVERYLTFRLDAEYYGVPVLDVREIIELQPITPVPRSEAHVCGVINLRGRVLPLIDLKLRFGLEAIVPSEMTVIIVIQPDGRPAFGVQVDEVLDVQRLGVEEGGDQGPLEGMLAAEFLQGVGKLRDRFVFLLDLCGTADGLFDHARAV
jgi:purine-binding chemotaxis protein CheW